VYPTYSKVISIIDDRFSVAVECMRTGDMGTVRGDSTLARQGYVRMEIRMERIGSASRIMPGDELMVSRLSYIYPPGVRVGTVVSVHTSPNGLSQYAIVRPAAHVGRVNAVLVVNRLFGPEHANEDEHVFINE
jgi:rod shape-determining protein MreC